MLLQVIFFLMEKCGTLLKYDTILFLYLSEMLVLLSIPCVFAVRIAVY
jgi:hypothetical protein